MVRWFGGGLAFDPLEVQLVGDLKTDGREFSRYQLWAPGSLHGIFPPFRPCKGPVGLLWLTEAEKVPEAEIRGRVKARPQEKGAGKSISCLQVVVSNLKGFSLQWVWPMMRWFSGFTKGFGSRPTFR